jgi:hypothetical protein
MANIWDLFVGRASAMQELGISGEYANGYNEAISLILSHGSLPHTLTLDCDASMNDNASMLIDDICMLVFDQSGSFDICYGMECKAIGGTEQDREYIEQAWADLYYNAIFA